MLALIFSVDENCKVSDVFIYYYCLSQQNMCIFRICKFRICIFGSFFLTVRKLPQNYRISYTIVRAYQSFYNPVRHLCQHLMELSRKDNLQLKRRYIFSQKCFITDNFQSSKYAPEVLGACWNKLVKLHCTKNQVFH